MALARLAIFVEFDEAFAEPVERALRPFTGRAHRIGGIARCVGDYGEVVAQPRHVGERGFGNARDPFHFLAIFGHQRFDAVGIFRQARCRNAAVRFQFAGLAGEEFPRKAQLAIDDREARFEFGNIARRGFCRVPKARALPPEPLARREPYERNEQGGDRPFDDCRAPAGRIERGETGGPARHREQNGPADQGEGGN